MIKAHVFSRHLLPLLAAGLLASGCGTTRDFSSGQQSASGSGETEAVFPVELLVTDAAGSVSQVDFVGRNDLGEVTATGTFQAAGQVLAQSSGTFEGEAEVPATTSGLQLEVSSDYQGITFVQQGVLEIRDPGALGGSVSLTVRGSDLNVKVPDLTGLRLDPVPTTPVPVGGNVRVVPSLPGKDFDPTPFLIFNTDPVFLARRDPVTQPGVFVPLRPFEGVTVRAAIDTRPSTFTGAGPGAPPVVKAFAGASGLTSSFFAFNPSFTGGVRVAAGDLDGDGRPEVVVGPDSEMEGTVRVFQPEGDPLGSFLAYPGFSGGVRVASGDLDGDGRAEIVTAPGPGMDSVVKVFDGLTQSQISNFLAFPGFTGGVTVATADLDSDGNSEIVVGSGRGTAPKVRVFDVNGNLVAEFNPYPVEFQGGVTVSGTDGRIATGPAGPGGGGEVKIFDPSGNLVDKLVPFPDYDDGLSVSWGDYDHDGAAELGVLPSGARPQSGRTLVIYEKLTLTNIQDLGNPIVRPYGIAAVDPLDGFDDNEKVFVSNFSSREAAANPVSTQVDATPSIGPRPLLVANSLGGAITGYDAPEEATGNVPPVLDLGPFNLPFHFASADQEGADIYLSNNGSHSISVLPQPVTGVTRTIGGLATTLNFPTGTALDFERDILYVFDAQAGQGRIKAFHNASTADGDPAPDRTLTGSFTNLFGAAYDPARDRLYAAEPGADRILVFDSISELTGATDPSHTLSVSGLTDPEGLYLDVPMQQLYVSSQSSGLMVLSDLDLSLIHI